MYICFLCIICDEVQSEVDKGRSSVGIGRSQVGTDRYESGQSLNKSGIIGTCPLIVKDKASNNQAHQ